MRIGDYLVPTTVDWPGKCAMIVWFAGCDFRCPFCQNGGIVTAGSGREESVDVIKKAIEENVRWIDGVVFSGGEPMLQEDALTEICAYTKEMKRGVLVDTNGSMPGVLKRMLSQGLIDRVALDIKAAPERYDKVSGTSCNVVEKVFESLNLALKSEAFVEIRTTVVPGLVGARDIKAISPTIKDCDVYYLQQFRPEGDLLDRTLSSVKPPSPKDMTKLARIAKKHVERVGIKTMEFGVQYL